MILPLRYKSSEKGRGIGACSLPDRGLARPALASLEVALSLCLETVAAENLSGASRSGGLGETPAISVLLRSRSDSSLCTRRCARRRRRRSADSGSCEKTFSMTSQDLAILLESNAATASPAVEPRGASKRHF